MSAYSISANTSLTGMKISASDRVKGDEESLTCTSITSVFDEWLDVHDSAKVSPILGLQAHSIDVELHVPSEALLATGPRLVVEPQPKAKRCTC